MLSPDSGWGVALLSNGNSVIAEEHVMETALNVARVAMGTRTVPVQVPLVLRLLVGLAVALPFVQIAVAARTVLRWRRGASQFRRTVLGVVGSLTGALWGVFVIAGLPEVFQSYWATMIAYQPDFALGLLASGAVGVLWSVLRIAITYAGR